MDNTIQAMIDDLKRLKISVSAIEKELGFSNGLLGKAAKGISELSKTKLELFCDYYIKKANDLLANNPNLKRASELPPNPLQIKPHSTEVKISSPVLDWIMDFCKRHKTTVEELQIWVETNYAKKPVPAKAEKQEPKEPQQGGYDRRRSKFGF